MKILFLGGTGIISSASVKLMSDLKMDISLLVRGISSQKRPVPAGVKVFHGDVNDEEFLSQFVAEHEFDVVVNWIAFVPEQVERDIRLFQGKVSQYVFISSASAYQKPIVQYPITENTPLDNPYWEYSRNKKACEALLMQAYKDNKFPATIVRPSHTYDKTLLPFEGGYTIVDRMLQGKPVIIHGDGTSLWTLTHHRDFATGFVPLLGNALAIGEAYHITSDELLTWNQIFEDIAKAFGGNLNAIHVPSKVLAGYDKNWGDGLLGDKMHSVVFDNTKIKTLVPSFEAKIPFAEGVTEIAAWYLADVARQKIDEDYSEMLDQIINEI